MTHDPQADLLQDFIRFHQRNGALVEGLEELRQGIGDCEAVARQLRRDLWFGTANLVERLPDLITALRNTPSDGLLEQVSAALLESQESNIVLAGLLREARPHVEAIEMECDTDIRDLLLRIDAHLSPAASAAQTPRPEADEDPSGTA